MKLSPLPILLILGSLFIGGYSYYRFVAEKHYIVEYEAECDAETTSCFVACEDEECTATYTYQVVRKYASDIYRDCGEDVSTCEAAASCQKSDIFCEVEVCEPDTDETTECSTPGEVTETPDEVTDLSSETSE